VVHPDDLETNSKGEVHTTVAAPPQEGSPLAMSILRVAKGASATIGPEAADTVVFGLDGGAEVADLTDEALAARYGSAVLVLKGERAVFSATQDGFAAIVMTVDASADEHASLGERKHLVQLDLGSGSSATSGRSYQVLFGADNGLNRATLFVGVVPTGAAPWHFHNYDEIVCILSGGGVYRVAEGDHPTRSLSTFRITPRTVHINENSSDADMLVLGLFTPSGSPSAAFLASAPRVVSAR
jgi:quercetin dioxygenase-like cupin family protein